MIHWIHRTNKESYETLMRQEGSQPTILTDNETDENIEVAFTVSAMNTWIMSGFWYN